MSLKPRSRYSKLNWYLSIVAMISIVVPAVLVSMIEIYSRFKSETTVRSTEQANALLKVLESGIRIPLWTLTQKDAQSLIAGIVLNDAVLSIEVVDDTGEPFINYKKKNYSSLIKSGLFIKKSSEVIYNESPIGLVSLEYSLVPAREAAISDSVRILFIIAIQAVISLTVILFVINRRVTIPLAKIKQGAQEISQQRFDTHIPTLFNDEFADVAKELNIMKEALRNSFGLLEERVEKRTQELLQLNSELTMAIQRLEGAKDNIVENEKLAALGALVAGVSHELNTPFGNGKVMANSLYESATRLNNAFKSGSMTQSQFESEVSEMIEGSQLLERNLDKAIKLVQSFKQIAVDRTSDQRRSFMVNSFILEVQATLLHIFKTTPHTLNVILKEDVELNSYPGVLSQVITNLINNALLHGLEAKAAGQVIIEVIPHVTQVEIKVIDDGQGMPQDVKKRIFEPFFTTKLGKGGSGLGMHIIHNLTTATLGGKVRVDSQVGVGTQVTLMIPLEAP